MANCLVHETSPYLLQHADNPVDWYPWGEKALQKARDEDKPVFLSIGYSACHWCHVMAHESFEDEDTAAALNEHFVSIKVDREERPDLDRIYMAAVQAMTGSGGWPMSVFLTPEGKPFYGGTYFPPRPRHGMPAFAQVLAAIAQAWRDRRAELLASSERVAQAMAQGSAPPAGTEGPDLDPGTLDAAVAQLRARFDAARGGWGTAPKFPQPMVIEFLLRHHHRTGDAEALQMATATLDAMARGGIYDQIGGGFHRYSVDERWLVPHFEKMLYDNAQLARVYLHAWQLTGNDFYRTIVEETLDYVVREMTDVGGGFYSTQDADSEGEEGKFFVWTLDEIREALEAAPTPALPREAREGVQASLPQAERGGGDGRGGRADAFLAAYGVTPGGNTSAQLSAGWEGKNILELTGSLEQRSQLDLGRRKLFEARETRVHPGRDEKILTSWNGLMLAAFAEAGRAFGRQDYREAAERNADFVLHELRQENGRLLRTWKACPERVLEGPCEGAGEAKLNGYLEDYAYLIEGLLELYQTTFEPRWYLAAQQLAETMIAHFRAPEGGFYDTSDDHEALITRPRSLQDNATPSGSAMAATVLLKLAGFTGGVRYADLARRSLAQMQSLVAQYPLGFGQWLQALSYALSQPREIAIVGDPQAGNTQALLGVVRSGYQPFQVVALGVPSKQPPAVPLLQNRGLLDGQAAAYVCRNSNCQTPVTATEALRTQLGHGGKTYVTDGSPAAW
jgi:uncharacterized protein YyaL (SSP411 family)